jgi:hypothetical protein
MKNLQSHNASGMVTIEPDGWSLMLFAIDDAGKVYRVVRSGPALSDDTYLGGVAFDVGPGVQPSIHFLSKNPLQAFETAEMNGILLHLQEAAHELWEKITRNGNG